MHINLSSQDHADMFWYKFEVRLVPSGDVAPKPAPLGQIQEALPPEIPAAEDAIQAGGAL